MKMTKKTKVTMSILIFINHSFTLYIHHINCIVYDIFLDSKTFYYITDHSRFVFIIKHHFDDYRYVSVT